MIAATGPVRHGQSGGRSGGGVCAVRPGVAPSGRAALPGLGDGWEAASR